MSIQNTAIKKTITTAKQEKQHKTQIMESHKLDTNHFHEKYIEVIDLDNLIRHPAENAPFLCARCLLPSILAYERILYVIIAIWTQQRQYKRSLQAHRHIDMQLNHRLGLIFGSVKKISTLKRQLIDFHKIRFKISICSRSPPRLSAKPKSYTQTFAETL